ncbi:hypothetical protein [Streptomyces sp. NPDC002156]
MTLTPAQIAVLDEVSAPALIYPAEVVGEYAPMLKYAGTTVNGQRTAVYPPLLADPTRD